MSLLWERFDGDTDQFGLRFSFQKDPDDGQGAVFEESLSWGSFQIWVGGRNLCAHSEEGETIDSVHWYLLPLIKWLAGNWDELLHEERLPAKNKGADSWTSLRATRFPPASLGEKEQETWEEEWHSWQQRHALQSCRDGGLFPDVLLRRWRDLVEVSWGDSTPAGAPRHFRFHSPGGFHRLRPELVAEPLYKMIRSASDYLIERAPGSLVLQELQREIEAIPLPKGDRRLALLAGLGERFEDRSSDWAKIRSTFPHVSNHVAAQLFGTDPNSLVLTGTCQAALMFGSVAPTISPDDAMTLAAWLVRLYTSACDDVKLESLCTARPLNENDQAWDQGYQLAEEFLQEIDLLEDSTDWIDIDQVYQSLGVGNDVISLDDHDVRAVAVASEAHRPYALLNKNHPTYSSDAGRRFTLAHELCHLLYDRSYGRQLAIASGPWAPRELEQRANAFAAMLLMPTELVSRVVRSLAVPLNSLAAVRQIAIALRTSQSATMEHLANLDFLDEADLERIRCDAESQLSLEDGAPRT